MTRFLRTLLPASALAALAFGTALPAIAQDGPVRVLVGFAPGSTSDSVARLLADRMKTSLGNPVIVDNRPGANGFIAAEALKNARPDGKTLMLAPIAVTVFAPFTHANLRYDPLKDFAPVSLAANFQFALAVGPASVIWNPVLAVVFAKIGTGLVLSWQQDLTRPRRLALAAVAWFAVQAHSAALPFALAMFLWILWTALRRGHGALRAAAVEAAVVVAVLQIPAMFAKESIRPTKIVAAMQEPQELRAGDSYRAVNDAIGVCGPRFTASHPTSNSAIWASKLGSV